jgi:hypothetical protein
LDIGQLEARATSAAFALSKGAAISSERYLAAICAERGMPSGVATTEVLPGKLDQFLFPFRDQRQRHDADVKPAVEYMLSQSK